MARWLTRLRLQAAAIVAVMLAVALTALLLAGRGIADADQFRQAASRASREIAASSMVLDSLQDAEAGVRGFLLTGRVVYLAPYQAGQERLGQALDTLQGLAADSPHLRTALPGLRRMTEARLADLTHTLDIAHRLGTAAAVARMHDDQGQAAMTAVRRRVQHIAAEAEAMREAGGSAVLRSEHQALTALATAALAGALLLGFASLGLLASHQRRQRMQSALAEQAERLAATIEMVRDGIAVFDAEDRLLLWNRSFFTISGIAESLAVPGTPYARIASAAQGWSPPLLSGRPPNVARRSGETQRGDRIVLEVWRSATPAGGQMVALADITRRSSAEAIAGKAQKMEAMGQLTGGVAHDFNNLLHVIAANLDLIGTVLPQGDARAMARLKAARAAVARGASLTRQLLAFARREPLRAAATEPAALLRGMEDLLRRTLDADIAIRFALDDKAARISVDPHQLENAVLNLAINARDAIRARVGEAGGGQIEISMAEAATAGPVPGIDQPVPPGRYVRIAVSDTGAGMSEAVLARAIDPFFTTKPVGKGSGLGLSQVYGFARQSGGHLRIDSVAGVGTTVALLLPALAETPAGPSVQPGLTPAQKANIATPQASPKAPSAPRDAEGLSILLVEDDAAVAAVALEMLDALGHRARHAGSAAAARACLASPTDEGGFEVLLIDRNLPDADGLALAGELAARHGGAKIIIASGDAPEMTEPGHAWLAKPYDLAALRAALSGLAGAPSALS